MQTEARSRFDAAAACEGQLNARQQDVLRLIADGYTNAQIAERCEITLDGAKWNVSEILGKLGLDSREEAADYWRWRSGLRHRLAAPMRAVVGLSAFKWIAAGGLAVVAIGASAVAWAATNGAGSASSGPGNQTTPPFVLEATITFTDTSKTADASIATASGNPDPLAANEKHQSSFTWTYRDATHYRYDIHNELPAFTADTIVMAADGTNQWTSYASTGLVQKSPMIALPAGYEGPFDTINPFLGPLPFKSIAELITQISAPAGPSDPGRHAAIVGQDTVLGTPCTVIEYGPTSTSSSTAGDGSTTSSGTAQICVDPARMVGMRITPGPGDSTQYTAVVTRFDYDANVPSSAVAFTPPAGATVSTTTGAVIPGISDVSGGSASGSQATAVGTDGKPLDPQPPSTFTVEAGFLKPALIPDGYSLQGTGTQEGPSGQGPVGITLAFRQTGGTGHLTIAQLRRVNGLPSAVKTGDKLTVDGNDAWQGMDGSNRTLVFEQDGISVQLTADTLPYTELEKVAASMSVAP